MRVHKYVTATCTEARTYNTLERYSSLDLSIGSYFQEFTDASSLLEVPKYPTLSSKVTVDGIRQHNLEGPEQSLAAPRCTL